MSEQISHTLIDNRTFTQRAHPVLSQLETDNAYQIGVTPVVGLEEFTPEVPQISRSQKLTLLAVAGSVLVTACSAPAAAPAPTHEVSPSTPTTGESLTQLHIGGSQALASGRSEINARKLTITLASGEVVEIDDLSAGYQPSLHNIRQTASDFDVEALNNPLIGREMGDFGMDPSQPTEVIGKTTIRQMIQDGEIDPNASYLMSYRKGAQMVGGKVVGGTLGYFKTKFAPKTEYSAEGLITAFGYDEEYDLVRGTAADPAAALRHRLGMIALNVAELFDLGDGNKMVQKARELCYQFFKKAPPEVPTQPVPAPVPTEETPAVPTVAPAIPAEAPPVVVPVAPKPPVVPNVPPVATKTPVPATPTEEEVPTHTPTPVHHNGGGGQPEATPTITPVPGTTPGVENTPTPGPEVTPAGSPTPIIPNRPTDVAISTPGTTVPPTSTPFSTVTPFPTETVIPGSTPTPQESPTPIIPNRPTDVAISTPGSVVPPTSTPFATVTPFPAETVIPGSTSTPTSRPVPPTAGSTNTPEGLPTAVRPQVPTSVPTSVPAPKDTVPPTSVPQATVTPHPAETPLPRSTATPVRQAATSAPVSQPTAPRPSGSTPAPIRP